MKKSLILMTLIVAVIFAFTACQSTDLVAKVGVTSFEAMTKAILDKVAYDSKQNVWVITAPDGKEKIAFSKDFSANQPDAIVQFDATPFIFAGLNPTMLPKEQYVFDPVSTTIIMPYEYGQDKFNAGTEKSITDTFKEIVRTHRDLLGYHEKLDHYGIALGNGNMLEWAKDMSTNDKDMVFVLNPEPFIKAGVDTSRLKDWVFAKVEVKDKEGKTELVDKFLKPYNLK